MSKKRLRKRLRRLELAVQDLYEHKHQDRSRGSLFWENPDRAQRKRIADHVVPEPLMEIEPGREPRVR